MTRKTKSDENYKPRDPVNSSDENHNKAHDNQISQNE